VFLAGEQEREQQKRAHDTIDGRRGHRGNFARLRAPLKRSYAPPTAGWSPRAASRRRASLDLIGLPPSPAEIDAFLADTAPGAWERVIDRLLASPHYGERWGRHWLDVARYADSGGFQNDTDRPHFWRYRDYVIQSFNADKPYDLFVKEQIAGDEFEHRTDETLIATGFLRAGPRVQHREKDNPERRHDYLDDVLGTIGKGVLGLTLQCARCHDHKFDPILTREYYSMQEVKRWYETIAKRPAVQRGYQVPKHAGEIPMP
jgi:hypothetical protein